MKIALDVDDVLAAFTPHSHTFYGKELQKCDYWCEKTTAGIYGREDWFSGGIAPVVEFWETLPILSRPEDIDFEFDCYMSAFPEKMRHLREKWLSDHGFPNKPLVVTFDKLSKCLELGIDVLVDDKPATIKLLQGSSVRGIHFLPFYAGFEPVGDYVVTNLKQVKQYL